MNIEEDRPSNYEAFKKRKLVRIFAFIAQEATPVDLANIIEEIRCVHDNLFAWDLDHKIFSKVESISLNNDDIQLNLESNKKENI